MIRPRTQLTNVGDSWCYTTWTVPQRLCQGPLRRGVLHGEARLGTFIAKLFFSFDSVLDVLVRHVYVPGLNQCFLCNGGLYLKTRWGIFGAFGGPPSTLGER